MPPLPNVGSRSPPAASAGLVKLTNSAIAAPRIATEEPEAFMTAPLFEASAGTSADRSNTARLYPAFDACAIRWSWHRDEPRAKFDR